jgi:type I restriction enzyme S subunit
MSRKFQVKTVPSAWLENNGRRLDCGPYLSGAMEAKEILRHLSVAKESLSTLTSGIYHAGREGRTWVESRDYGVPFMGSTDILAADLANLPFLSKKQIAANPDFTIREGWTLITRSGTIGRMAYARSDMDGIACSEHVMRVVPNVTKVKPGFLFAYLSGRFGLPIILSGTYGSIIQSIEPHHIADLPVPRLGEIETLADDLIQQAANKRVDASMITQNAIDYLKSASGLEGLEHQEGIPFCAGSISSVNLLKRMDGAYHSALHREVLDALNNAGVKTTTVADLSLAIFEPTRFKRVEISDAEFGIPMFGTTALMWADPKPSFLIPRRMQGIEELIVDKKMVLIPRSGQIAGIIGTAVLPYGALIGGTVSEDAIRIQCATETIAGYLFIVLRSEYGRRQLKARAFGSSIPHLDVHQIGHVLIPNLGNELVKQIGSMGVQSARLRHEAIEHENEARSLVERSIESGGR